MTEKKIRVQDDLYQFVNHEWLENAVIPDDKPTTGGSTDLNDNVEKLLISDLNKMSDGSLACPNQNVKKAIDIFNIAKNIKRRNKEGIKPLLKTLNKIYKLTNMTSFNRNLKEFVINGLPLPFVLDVSPDMKDTLHHCLIVGGPSVILPDTTYYKEEMKPQRDMLLNLWSDMALKLLSYTKLTEEEQKFFVEDALKFDSMLANLVKSSEEWSEYTKIYNPMKTSKVGSLLKPVKFKKLVLDTFGDVPDKIIVAEPRYLNGFKTVFNEENFELYKHWAYVLCLTRNSSLLSEELRVIGSSYSLALSGVNSVTSIEKQAYQIACGCFSEPIGLYYGETYFGEHAKKDVVDIVNEIIKTYKKRILDNSFLLEETKKKAIVKLEKIVVKMGYPDKSDDFYNSISFDQGKSLFEVLSSINMQKNLYNFSKLFKDVNREEWLMSGHIVNACYNPFTNDITFPAAILQAPFYSINQTRSENLGGIGAVIGHEISHAFDNNGAQCDENGNLNNWWTKEDQKRFKNKTKAMIKQFDGIELEEGTVNGTFVVSENIADNGGMAVTLNVMSTMENPNYKEYFYNWARVWCIKAKPEFKKLLLSIDVHSPAVLRANIQPQNFDEWYKTFNVKKTDKMYITPSKRIIIW